ncbi:Mov34/MPN/PAD-1 family protein [Granulicella paludicola]|jgi:hypothetical protein|uniref:Mov34/MPN/PAD-1 family protein n=1 Tax=Granulicella paludicola TaxID=474951 RepID=UPI0021DFEA9C|nr:Mov34/MPN/PAD-1 family protein [Granulicella paludicola]
MAGFRLADIEEVTVARDVVAATLETLQAYGKHGFEGLVLWLGEVSGRTAFVTRALVPDQEPTKSEDGVGYFVDGETLFRLNRVLASSGLRLLAQVHSHPTNAYHSEADDRYAIVTAEGGLSLVVPNFGKAPFEPCAWAVYRLSGGQWKHMEHSQAQNLIRVGISS